VWNIDRSVVGLRLGTWPEWLLPRAAFADDAKFHAERQGSRLQIRIDRIRFAGVPPVSIELLFEKRQTLAGLRWQFSIANGLLPDQRGAPVLLSDFLAKERQAAGVFGVDEAAPDGKDLPQIALSKQSGQS